jgi:hypothetical protein
MAVAKKTLKKKAAEKERTETKTARKGNSSKRTITQAKTEQEMTTNLPQDENLDGEQILLDAVNREVAQKSSEIARKLASQAANGNSSSTKLVMEMLTDRKTKSKKTKRTRPTLAEKLDMEKKWSEPETAAKEQESTREIHN